MASAFSEKLSFSATDSTTIDTEPMSFAKRRVSSGGGFGRNSKRGLMIWYYGLVKLVKKRQPFLHGQVSA